MKVAFRNIKWTVGLVCVFGVIGCSGAIIASTTPQTQVTIEGVPFAVAQTSSGLTIRNFETGRTAPALLITYAGRAAETVSGCPLTHITKETGVNTYYATVACPTA